MVPKCGPMFVTQDQAGVCQTIRLKINAAACGIFVCLSSCGSLTSPTCAIWMDVVGPPEIPQSVDTEREGFVGPTKFSKKRYNDALPTSILGCDANLTFVFAVRA